MNQSSPHSSHPGRHLPRTLEPEVMDAAQEVREYQQMDHESVNHAFVDDLVAGGTVGPKVMDLGCGTGEIAILVCQRLEDVQVMGVDLSVEMLEVARIEIELGGVQGRVFLENADCKTLDHFERASSDTVISNTVLHHIADPEPFLHSAVDVLAPGGRLFLRDLMRPADEATVESLVVEHAGGESEYAQQLLRQSLHAALTLEEIQALVEPLGIPASAINATSDRHWTIDWVKPA